MLLFCEGGGVCGGVATTFCCNFNCCCCSSFFVFPLQFSHFSRIKKFSDAINTQKENNKGKKSAEGGTHE